MLKNVITSFVTLIALSAVAQPIDVNFGTIELPSGFIVVNNPGIDTTCPNFIRTNDNFTIESDIGKMAGWKAHPLKKDDYDSLTKTSINGTMACIASETIAGKKYIYATLAETFSTDLEGLSEEEYRKRRDNVEPVNFYAEIASDRDLIDFMLLVCSYKKKSDKNSNLRVGLSMKTPGD